MGCFKWLEGPASHDTGSLFHLYVQKSHSVQSLVRNKVHDQP
jgi:hypothetical protein